MIKAEPRTILNFLNTYFDVVRDLFEYQQQDGLITKEVFDMICHKHGAQMKSRLREYRVVRSIGSDFEMRDVYFKLMEFGIWFWLVKHVIEAIKVSLISCPRLGI